MDDIKFLKPDKKMTSNYALIRAAFASGFNQGVMFMNESESMNSDVWRRKAFKKFCKKHKVSG